LEAASEAPVNVHIHYYRGCAKLRGEFCGKNQQHVQIDPELRAQLQAEDA
jgi:hypothetical protein